ncbi:MAG: hypothetical protein Q4C42_06475, partial [Clostridia bacterium]|nr:hypothetical protein [Clostridia bacterium]
SYSAKNRDGVPKDIQELLEWAETSNMLTRGGNISELPEMEMNKEFHRKTETGEFIEYDISNVSSLVGTVEDREPTYESLADDAGQQRSFAIRNNDMIELGASGCSKYENTDPAAQALYKILREAFPEVTAFEDDEYIAPAGFIETPILEYCGYEKVNLSKLKMQCLYNDCEEAPYETDPKLTAEEIASMVVTGKANSFLITGGSCYYRFTDKSGEQVAFFEFYDDLLVTDDGMYYVKY